MATDLPVVRELVAFPHRMRTGAGWVASFADASPRCEPGQCGNPWHVLHRWAVASGQPDVAAYAATARAHPLLDLDSPPPTSGLGRFIGALGNEDWRAAGSAPGPLAQQVWLPSTQVLVTRASTDGKGLALVLKGGHNGEAHNHEAHNHLDVGAVAVAVDGEPLVVDLGRTTYRATTFSDQRYTEWHLSSAWHSVPAPVGLAQRVGESSAAGVRVDDDAAGLTLDLSALYEWSGRWLRHAWLTPEGAVVEDSWAGAEPVHAGEPGARIPWVLAGEVTLHGSCAVVHPRGSGRALRVSWTSSASDVTARVIRRELDDPYLRAAWGPQISRLDLFATGPSAKVTTRFTMA